MYSQSYLVNKLSVEVHQNKVLADIKSTNWHEVAKLLRISKLDYGNKVLLNVVHHCVEHGSWHQSSLKLDELISINEFKLHSNKLLKSVCTCS